VAGVAGVPAAILADAAGVALTVIVLVGVAAGLPLLPHPPASAGTQLSAAPASIRRGAPPANTRRSMVVHGVIARFFLPGRLRKPYDRYDVLCFTAVGRCAHVGEGSFPGR
jgi:hypothetical protein